MEQEPTILELVRLARELSVQRLEIEHKEDWVKDKIRIYLKERSIREFVDKDSETTIRMDVVRKETLDKEKIKSLLSERHWSQVIKITSYEKISIITPEVRQRMKAFAKKSSIML